MPQYVIRFRENESQRIGWAVKSETDFLRLPGQFENLGELVTHRAQALAEARQRADMVSKDAIQILSPATASSQLICQGKNYSEHIREGGENPADKTFNLFFQKASSSVSGPDDPIVRPSGVRLLDYELELALVIGKSIVGPAKVNSQNLHEFVCGLVMANDVSARDIQIPQNQWFKGKSFRGFCPLGPYVAFLEADEIAKIQELDLELKVNGEVRQSSGADAMIYRPEETIAELSTILDLHPGDLVLTGTPSGVAMQAPSALVQRLAAIFLSPGARNRLFVKKQLHRSQYLKNDDLVESTIRTQDGALDLGIQRHRVE